MNLEKQSTNLQMTLREVNKVGEGQKNVPKLRFKGYEDAWEQRKFSDIALRESTVQESSRDFPSVEYEDVIAEAGRLNKDVNQKEVAKKGIVFDGSQVLYGKLRPYLHNWLSPDFSGVAVGDWWVLKPIKVDKSFLYRLIQTQQFDDIANQSTGSKMPRADWNLVSNLEFAVPVSGDEQYKIGGYFSSLDTLIALHQRKYDALKSMKKTLLSKMFPKNGEDVPEIRFKGYTDAWEQRRLEEIFLKIRNAFVGTSTPYYVEKNQGGHFYIESNNVKHGQINHDTEVFINEEFYQNQKDKWLKTGDIVMVQSGHVGHSAVIPEYLNNSAAHALIMFQEYLIETNPNFINFQFQTESVRNKIDSITTGNTIKHILASDMKLFSISNTQKKEADKLGDFFISLDNLITLHQRKLDELKNMKKTLLQQMFV